MSRFLLGALVMGAVFALASFASRVSVDPVVKPTGGPAWTVSQYQLDRAFRLRGNFPSQTLQVPSGSGCIITQIRVGYGYGVTFAINGATESFGYVGSGIGDGDLQNLNPPIILRPGDVFSYTSTLVAGVPADVALAGYTTLPGET